MHRSCPESCISIFSASLILNWEDDSEIYHDRKTKSEHNGDEEEGLNVNSGTKGPKVSIPTHLSPVFRTKRFIFVFLFMFVDATLTIRNVSLGDCYLVDILWGQLIKLAQVASTSKLLENQRNTLRFFEIILCHFCGASEVQT